MQIRNGREGLPRSDRSACSAYLGGTRRCNVVVYIVSPRQTARAGKRPRVTAKTKPSPSISDTAHAFTHACSSQCAEGLHFSAFHFTSTCALDVHIKNVLDNGRRKVNQLHSEISNRDNNLSARRLLLLAVVRLIRVWE